MIQILGLIRETFLEAVSRKVMIGFFIISTLVLIILSLYLSSSGVSAVIESLQPTPDDPKAVALSEMVYSLQIGLGGAFFYAAIFFSIFITANIIPSTMERGTIDLLLSKPMSRARLLAGKLLGGFAVTAVNIVYFMVGSWLIVSVATGVWNTGYLLAFAPVFLGFLSLYSILALVGITTQSSALGMIICYLIASVIGGLLYSREQTLFQLIRSDEIRSLITMLYYALPQLPDLNKTTSDLIQNKTVDSVVPLYNALGFSAVFFTLSLFFFRKKEF